jgi:TolA-binding protein
MKRAAISLACLLVGCGYNNGMYNANRLAGEATRAEREGRTLDASGLWGQVAVKAESIMVRSPRSRSIERVRFLRGMALSRTGDCASAAPYLEQVANGGDQDDMVEQATALLGECRLQLGDPSGASAVYGRLIGSHDRTRRHRALLRHGRALRLEGAYEQAFAELQQSEEPAALGERAAALAGLGQVPALLAVADSLIARQDTAAPWDATLELLGAHDEAAASGLVERLRQMPGLPPAIQARWIYGDGRRLLAKDTTRGLARLDEVTRLPGAAGIAGEAKFTIARFHLDRADSLAELRSGLTALEDLQEGSGDAAPMAAALAGSIRAVLAACEAISPETPLGDLKLFLAAEAVRDSVQAPLLAANLFAQVAETWPQSPFAPKALLAVAHLDSTRADSAWLLLRDRYPDSPYLAILRGEDPPAYRALEDSLRVFAGSERTGAVRTPARRTAAPGTRKPNDLP